jgi:dTDP-4-amino-4,6-dideoxygalactose transaminase
LRCAGHWFNAVSQGLGASGRAKRGTGLKWLFGAMEMNIISSNTNLETIPWFKPDVGADELAEIADSFKADWLTMGPKVAAFEQRMAERMNVKHAIAVTNGSIAIDIALLVAGIKPGDEVIVPSMTYFATAAAVSRIGAVPVFVDIEELSHNLDPKLLHLGMSPKTKAALFIDYGGVAAQVDELKAEAARLGIRLIQDGAQSLGAVYKGQPMGAQTEISTMSFHIAKVMACVEGGMIFTHNDDFAREARIFRNQGETVKYQHSHLGFNARMTDINASIGLAQERKLDAYLAGRKRVVDAYDRHFSGSNRIELMQKPQPGCAHANFLYNIKVANQAEVVAALKKAGIETRISYPMAVYEQEVYRTGAAASRKTPSPVAERVAKSIISLPLFPDMTDAQVSRVAEVVFQAAA